MRLHAGDIAIKHNEYLSIHAAGAIAANLIRNGGTRKIICVETMRCYELGVGSINVLFAHMILEHLMRTMKRATIDNVWEYVESHTNKNFYVLFEELRDCEFPFKGVEHDPIHELSGATESVC